MFEETKTAVLKAFEVGKVLFKMGAEKYNKLLEATIKIKPPTIEELEVYIEGGMVMEDAMIEVLKERYVEAALNAGFTKEQGLAMLSYAAMMEEIDDDEI